MTPLIEDVPMSQYSPGLVSYKVLRLLNLSSFRLTPLLASIGSRISRDLLVHSVQSEK
jgi:hypothetical protein